MWRSEAVIACSVALAVVCVALWDALLFCGSSTLGAWDLFAQSNSLTRVDAGGATYARAGDALRQFVPWALFARDELAHGRIPLWCPQNGAGIPLLANYQSAVFSPFTLPFYVLPLKLALLVSAASKLFVAAASMFLFVRSLGRSRWAASVAAVSYGLCGFNLWCMLHPHVGVLALLPLALLFVDRAARGFDEQPERVPLGALAGLAVALGTMALAGHPESLLFGVYCVAAFAGYHVARFAWLWRHERAPLRRTTRFASALLVAGVCGGAIGAVQILPFVEYVLASASFAAGARESTVALGTYPVLQLFPDVTGALLPSDATGNLMPGFQEGNVYFVGGTTAILALGSLLFVRRSADAAFFAVLGLVALSYGLEVPVVSRLFGPLFGAGYVLASRSSPLWTVSACVLAAFTLDQFRRRPQGALEWRALGLAVAGVAALLASRASIAEHWSALVARDSAGASGPPATYVGAQSVAIAVGLASCVALAWIEIAAVRRTAWALLVAATALQCSLGFDAAHSVVDDRFVAPRTPAIEGLKATVGDERVVLLANEALQPNANLFYDLSLVGSYDALEVHELDELRAALFGRTGYAATTTRASCFALDLFGASFVATPGEWLPLDGERSGAGDMPWQIAAEGGFVKHKRFATLDREHARIQQSVAASRDGLDGLVVHFCADRAAVDARVSVELLEPASGSSLARREVRLGELRPVFGARLECVLDVPKLERSSGKTYALEVRVVDFGASSQVRLVGSDRGRREERENGATLVDDGLERREAHPRFVLDVSYDRSRFERVGEFGDLVVHRSIGAPGRAWIASGVIGAVDSAAALRRTLAADFDPRNLVVLEGAPSTPPASGTFALERTGGDSLSSSFRARCDAPAHLVLAQPWYPGWKAFLDGREVELLRANHAFSAVALPRGASEIELSYEPASFRLGAALSIVGSLVIAAAATAASRRRARCTGAAA